MKLVACVSVGLVAAVLPLVARARPKLAQGQKVVYSWNYESDSGYADTNECVRMAVRDLIKQTFIMQIPINTHRVLGLDSHLLRKSHELCPPLSAPYVLR